MVPDSNSDISDIDNPLASVGRAASTFELEILCSNISGFYLKSLKTIIYYYYYHHHHHHLPLRNNCTVSMFLCTVAFKCSSHNWPCATGPTYQ